MLITVIRFEIHTASNFLVTLLLFSWILHEHKRAEKVEMRIENIIVA